jgi:AraC-like DNA-binding protein
MAQSRTWIEDVEIGSPRSPGHPVMVLPPDLATSVVWRVTAAGQSDVLIAGPRTRASYQPAKDLPVCVRLRIRPGLVIPILGIAADELVDRIVPLGDLWGSAADSLAAELTAHRDDPAQSVDLLASRLVAGGPTRTSGRFDLVTKAARELAAGTAVRRTAERVGVSERYLRRVFGQAVGVSPKHFARIARVRTLLTKPLPQNAGSWSTAAADAGYFDQSHLVAEFRSIMRVTPGAFAAGRVPLTTC